MNRGSHLCRSQVPTLVSLAPSPERLPALGSHLSAQPKWSSSALIRSGALGAAMGNLLVNSVLKTVTTFCLDCLSISKKYCKKGSKVDKTQQKMCWLSEDDSFNHIKEVKKWITSPENMCSCSNKRLNVHMRVCIKHIVCGNIRALQTFLSTFRVGQRARTQSACLYASSQTFQFLPHPNS